MNAHARLATPTVTVWRFAKRRFPGEPHYGGRDHDGGDLAFLFLNISGDLV
jgi:hypothetical protein